MRTVPSAAIFKFKTINASSGLISGRPTIAGSFTSTVSVSDGNFPAASTSVQWIINDVLTLQPVSGNAVQAGTTVPLSVTAVGGQNPRFRWSFGDGTPDSPLASSPGVTHTFTSPGRFLITVTVRDDTGRELTASYRQGVHAPIAAGQPGNSSSLVYAALAGAAPRLWVVNPDQDTVSVFDVATRAKLAEIAVGVSPKTLSLAPDGRVWVANAVSATLTVIRPDFTVAQTIALPRGSRPFGVLADAARSAVYVALEASGQVLKLNPANGSVLGSLAVGSDVRHLALSPDGSRLLVSRFVTPKLPGEETALVNFLGGGSAQPTAVPPRPFERGVGGRPTLVQNVETLAHVAQIARFGPAWFRAIGTTDDPGSMLMTLSGAVAKPGIVEVAFGTRLGDVIAMGGGTTADLSAILIGGYYGSWIAADRALELPLTNASLRAAGAGLGCGVLHAFSARTCGVQASARIARYLAGESAGQCGPCLYGLKAVADSMDEVAAGMHQPGDVERLERWCAEITGRGACSYPDGVVRFVASALDVFGDEIERHAEHGRCLRAEPSALPLPDPALAAGGWR